MPFSRGSSQPRDQTQVSCIAGGFFTILEVASNLYTHSVTQNGVTLLCFSVMK